MLLTISLDSIILERVFDRENIIDTSECWNIGYGRFVFSLLGSNNWIEYWKNL